MIFDNKLQFDSKVLRRYYSELGIKNMYCTLQAKATNKVVINWLKRRLEEFEGR